MLAAARPLGSLEGNKGEWRESIFFKGKIKFKNMWKGGEVGFFY